MENKWIFQPEPLMGGAAGDAYAKTLNAKTRPREHILVREAGQNSCDAWDHDSASPVRIVFRQEELDEHATARFEEVTRIGAQFSERNSSLNLKTTETVDRLKDGNPGTRLLFIEDYNTVGLGGPLDITTSNAHFRKLALSLGVADKLDGESSGGSYGFGKAVYSSSSDCKTIFFYSVFRPTEDTKGHSARLMGCSYFKTHEFAGKRFTGRAWWGVGLSDESAEPFHGDEAHELAEKLGFHRRGPEEYGTSILVVGSLPLEMSKIRRAFELYWWPRIWEHNLDVELIERGVPTEPPRPRQNPAVEPYIRAFEIALETRTFGEREFRQPIRVQNSDSPGMVAAVFVDRDAVVEDEFARLGSVAYIRTPRMVVTYDLVGWDYLPGFAGVFVADDKMDGTFKKSEPPEHDIWSEHAEELDENERSVVRRTVENVKGKLKTYQKQLTPPPPPGGTRLVFLEKMLGKLFKVGGDLPKAPSKVSDPVHIRFEKNERVEADGGTFVESEIHLSLDDNYAESTLPIELTIRLPLLADDNKRADEEAIPISVKFDEAEESPEYQEKFVRTLSLDKGKASKCFIRSAAFPAEWAARIEFHYGPVSEVAQ